MIGISLARAVYSDAKLFLLDDLFASLDVHVCAHVFERCILGLLRSRGCTVILITHQAWIIGQHVHKLDRCMWLSDGQLIESANPQKEDLPPQLYNALGSQAPADEMQAEEITTTQTNVEEKFTRFIENMNTIGRGGGAVFMRFEETEQSRGTRIAREV